MESYGKHVALKIEEAGPLRELYSLRFDLSEAEDFCQHAIADHQTRAWAGTVVQEGLIVAAVIAYARCFHSGSRERLRPDDIDDLKGDVAETHDYYYTLRDKFIAHAVNTFDEAGVSAIATVENRVRLPITELAPSRTKFTLSIVDAHRLLPVIAVVAANIDARIALEKSKLLAYINTLPLDSVHSGDFPNPVIDSEADVGSPAGDLFGNSASQIWKPEVR